MKHFTVIRPRTVLRVQARSIQALTRALHDVGIRALGIYEDGTPVQATVSKRRRRP